MREPVEQRCVTRSEDALCDLVVPGALLMRIAGCEDLRELEVVESCEEHGLIEEAVNSVFDLCPDHILCDIDTCGQSDGVLNV